MSIPTCAASSVLDVEKFSDATSIMVSWSIPRPDAAGKELAEQAKEQAISLKDRANQLQRVRRGWAPREAKLGRSEPVIIGMGTKPERTPPGQRAPQRVQAGTDGSSGSSDDVNPDTSQSCSGPACGSDIGRCARHEQSAPAGSTDSAGRQCAAPRVGPRQRSSKGNRSGPGRSWRALHTPHQSTQRSALCSPIVLPTHWSPEQTLAVFEILDELRDLVWDRYGLQIQQALREDRSDPMPIAPSDIDDSDVQPCKQAIQLVYGVTGLWGIR